MVASSGNVGIGTTSPSSELHVIGDVNISKELTVSGAGTVRGIAMNDDTAISFTPESPQGMLFIYSLSTDFFIIGYAVDATPESYELVDSSARLTVGTAALTGTDGTDGQFNVGAVSDGKIYLENRLGGAATINYFVMG